MKFYCRNCGKIKEIIEEGFCSLKCKEEFVNRGACGNCNGFGLVPCMAGGKDKCDACNGTGKGKYTKHSGFC